MATTKKKSPTFPRGRTLWVRATDDKPCPKIRARRQIDGETGRDRNKIYGDPVEVPNVRYYRTRVAAGDLELIKKPSPAKKALSKTGRSSQ